MTDSDPAASGEQKPASPVSTTTRKFMTTGDPTTDARAKLIAARKAYIAAITDFRVASGHLPFFLLDVGVKPIEQKYLENCEVVASRAEMLRRLPKGGRLVEVGTFKGAFAHQILDIVEPDELTTIDITYENFNYARLQKHPLYSRMKHITGNSYEELEKLPPGAFDMIYIDANHTYPFVSKDIAATNSKLRPGGLLIANDYTAFAPFQGFRCGVVKAINEFIREEKKYNVQYFVLNWAGYYDIALKKSVGTKTRDRRWWRSSLFRRRPSN
jgi:predicted O-methyltransferase YrrM